MLGNTQQAVDQRGQIPQASFQMLFDPMIHLLGMKELSHPTEIGFDAEALVPPPALTALDVLGGRVFGPQALVSQCDRLAIVGGRQRAKDVVMFVGRRPAPVNYLAGIVRSARPA